VTDKKIEQTIDDGATTMRELAKELNVGSQCGKCCGFNKKILNSKLIQIADITDQVA
jgi:bacterioferritin-associated ferredoxin